MTEQLREAPASPAPEGAEQTAPALRPVGTPGAFSASGVLLLLGLLVVLVAGWHLTQGTSGLGFSDLAPLILGQGTDEASNVLVGSRIPRLAAGIAVGFALGVAGALFQSLARNALASPDTLAVTGGAYLAVTTVAAFGLAVPLWASGLTAFGGGIAAAALVLGLAGGAGTATTRLVLAGTATAMALQAATSALLILFEEETTSLFAWGKGSLSQLGMTAFQQAGPVVLVATGLALLLARRLDLLGLGDDSAAALGVPVRSTRAIGVVLAVLLTAAAVTLAGPIGFVGLFAPVAVRLCGRFVPTLHRHVVLLPAAGLVGALAVLLADVAVRGAIGAGAAIRVPTGVTTTVVGAVVMILLARQGRDSGPAKQPAAARVGPRSRLRFRIVLVVALLLAGGVALVGLLAGDTWLRLGDIALWANGEAPPFVSFVLDVRAPRVAAAVAAGAALALAGSMVQATCRNPLAEPGILGITGGAGVGAVVMVTANPSVAPSTTAMLVAATIGALTAFALVYGLAWRGRGSLFSACCAVFRTRSGGVGVARRANRPAFAPPPCQIGPKPRSRRRRTGSHAPGLNADRLLLIGIGTWYGSVAISAYLLIRSDPWDTPRIFTWLSGTTYGRTWEQVLPVLVAMAIALPLTFVVRRELDLLALDEDTPRLVGVGLEKVRLLVLVVAALLAAMTVAAVGTVGFVGLVAPHMARALVGGRHSRSVPVAIALGAALLGIADLVGRTVIAPAQLPAGLCVAVLGAPYFIYLLARSRA